MKRIDMKMDYVRNYEKRIADAEQIIRECVATIPRCRKQETIDAKNKQIAVAERNIEDYREKMVQAEAEVAEFKATVNKPENEAVVYIYDTDYYGRKTQERIRKAFATFEDATEWVGVNGYAQNGFIDVEMGYAPAGAVANWEKARAEYEKACEMFEN